MGYTLGMDTRNNILECDDCLRLDTCHQWANFSCHDEHPPVRCHRYETDPAVLDNEMIELELLKLEMAEADLNDPPPF